MNSFETTILNGFPVTVEFDIYPPDYSSYSSYAEITNVTLRDGKSAEFITRQLTEVQWIRLNNEADEHVYED